LRSAIAALLSLFLAGMGQVYVRRTWRGLFFALCSTAMDALAVKFRLFLTFAGGVASVLVVLAWHAFVVCDAICLAWRYDPANPLPRNEKATIAAVLAIVLLVGYPVPDYFRSRMLKFFRAYRTSSGSMCPTICEGERIVVASDACESRNPTRGDLLIFDFNHGATIFPKRVIGVAGDTVARGPKNTILVNGVAIVLPRPCGKGVSFAPRVTEGLPFETIKVPDDSIFVIGDNLDNSYDSRFFGPIPLDEVRGRPLFVYWSSNRTRIGCELH
jgi:signal peptidase I